MRIRLIAAALGTLAALGPVGCASLLGPPREVTPNPLLVPAADFEAVWKQTIAVVDEYFDIASENRLSRRIVTQPKVAATLLEPWAGDSIGLDQRAEATLQTIRRFAKVAVDPAPNGGGWIVKVEVYKELEDLVKPDRSTGGRAVFNDFQPPNRSRDIVGPVPVPLQWIPRGRDHALEQVILARIRKNLFL